MQAIFSYLPWNYDKLHYLVDVLLHVTAGFDKCHAVYLFLKVPFKYVSLQDEIMLIRFWRNVCTSVRVLWFFLETKAPISRQRTILCPNKYLHGYALRLLGTACPDTFLWQLIPFKIEWRTSVTSIKQHKMIQL